MKNEIIVVTLAKMDEQWIVSVVKTFAPENGGGNQTFRREAGSVHHALDIAREMVTVSPTQRTDAAETLPFSFLPVTCDHCARVLEGKQSCCPFHYAEVASTYKVVVK